MPIEVTLEVTISRVGTIVAENLEDALIKAQVNADKLNSTILSVGAKVLDAKKVEEPDGN